MLLDHRIFYIHRLKRNLKIIAVLIIDCWFARNSATDFMSCSFIFDSLGTRQASNIKPIQSSSSKSSVANCIFLMWQNNVHEKNELAKLNAKIPRQFQLQLITFHEYRTHWTQSCDSLPNRILSSSSWWSSPPCWQYPGSAQILFRACERAELRLGGVTLDTACNWPLLHWDSRVSIAHVGTVFINSNQSSHWMRAHLEIRVLQIMNIGLMSEMVMMIRIDLN